MSAAVDLQSPGRSRSLRPGTKRFKVLQALLESGEAGIDCFQAARFMGDYVLRSTMSDIQRQYGLSISRRPHVCPNGFGGDTHCVRYWIEGAARDHAVRLLGSSAGTVFH